MQETWQIAAKVEGREEPLGQLGPPAPSPPELVSKLPFEQFPSCTLPKPSHTPDPGVGGLTGLRPLPPTPKAEPHQGYLARS